MCGYNNDRELKEGGDMVMTKEEKIAVAKLDRKNEALGRRNCFKNIAWQKADAMMRSLLLFVSWLTYI